MIKKQKNKKMRVRLYAGLMCALMLIGVLGVITAVYIKRNIVLEADVEVFRNAKTDSVTRFFYYPYGTNEPIEIENSAVCSSERRLYVEYKDIPEDLINAFVAIEDKRFYDHEGVDWYRTGGAALNYIFKFRDSFGASTITQQLVKNVTGEDEYKIERKLQEIFTALSLEKKMDKNEILELYLNIINLSQGCKGVGAGAETYFSKTLSELDLGECVCLAAITNSPTYYDPYLNPEHNKERRRLIYDQMLAQGYIDKETYDEWYDADVTLNMSANYQPDKINSWYVDMVIDDVCADLCEEYGYSSSEASELVYGGGLNIYTAMDPEVQSIIESYYKNESNFPDAGAGIKAQSSMIIIDPKNGNILGVAGARGEKTANRVQSYATKTKRPSGSVVKPLSIYAPALEDGLITYAAVFDDVPVSFGDYNLDASKGQIVLPSPWPGNAPTVYHGLVNVNYSMEVSLNTVPVRILELMGKERSFYFLRDSLGCSSLIESLTLENGVTLTDMDTAALALGQMNYGVTLREITGAYSIFPTGGEFVKPRSYTLVTDSKGNVLLENSEEKARAISYENSIIMNQMMQNVIDYGTAAGQISLDKTITVSGKTGTSQDYYDRWFIGYTPYCIGGVWYGYEYPKPLNNDTKHICTEIWDDVMVEVHGILSKREKREYPASDKIVKVEYCRDSGKLMTDACRKDPRGERSEMGYFVSGTEPTEKCDRHLLVKYDNFCKCIADPSCPKENITYVGLIKVERHFPIQVYVSDAQYVWRRLPNDVLPGSSDNEPFFINTIKKGDYCGISYSEKQFNRSCKEHFNYLAWLLGRKVHN